MAVPKKRRSKSKKRAHRSSWKISVPTLVACPNCSELMVPHRTCTSCGYYKGRPVMQIKVKEKAKKD